MKKSVKFWTLLGSAIMVPINYYFWPHIFKADRDALHGIQIILIFVSDIIFFIWILAIIGEQIDKFNNWLDREEEQN